MNSINLLPGKMRQDIVYARRNTNLLKLCVFMVCGIASIGAVVIMGLTYIKQATKNLEGQIKQSEQALARQDLEGTQARVKELSDSFNLAIKVLSRQVLFSKLLEQAGAVMPAGSALSSLTIDELEGGIDLEVLSTDYQKATQVQVNLQDPENKLFEKVDIVNIACSDDKKTNYPCTGTYRVLFASENPFTLLGDETGDES